ncbi:hypothetical protein SCLCIDRAFT_20467 [Scleroderma citrinum Foug A]|uniref:Uncharacterized protein n=1 Tax=Scleroderma citrinum Foug A TaxID=1036808 RepID=A0A0C3EJ91_9AGAM|nr:hypothetical protein SCLCIDRAFT_20467 [Scleroderma citrinum Foug A]
MTSCGEDFTVHQRSPPDVPKQPPRKRTRTLPYQGLDDTGGTLRSTRLKRPRPARTRAHPKPAVQRNRHQRKYSNEISADTRGVVLLTERGGTSIHGLSAPSRAVMILAVEAKLKWLIKQALSLTSTSYAIASIDPSAPRSTNRVLAASSFDVLSTISPAVLPSRSAAALKLAIGENDSDDEEIISRIGRCEISEGRSSLLGERRTVKEAPRQL